MVRCVLVPCFVTHLLRSHCSSHVLIRFHGEFCSLRGVISKDYFLTKVYALRLCAQDLLHHKVPAIQLDRVAFKQAKAVI